MLPVVEDRLFSATEEDRAPTEVDYICSCSALAIFRAKIVSLEARVNSASVVQRLLCIARPMPIIVSVAMPAGLYGALNALQHP
jgi:hypothetical protein